MNRYIYIFYLYVWIKINKSSLATRWPREREYGRLYRSNRGGSKCMNEREASIRPPPTSIVVSLLDAANSVSTARPERETQRKEKKNKKRVVSRISITINTLWMYESSTDRKTNPISRHKRSKYYTRSLRLCRFLNILGSKISSSSSCVYLLRLISHWPWRFEFCHDWFTLTPLVCSRREDSEASIGQMMNGQVSLSLQSTDNPATISFGCPSFFSY